MIVTTESGEKHYVYKLGESLQEAKEQIFLLTFENCGWNKMRTARALGLHLRTVRLWVTNMRKNGREFPKRTS